MFAKVFIKVERCRSTRSIFSGAVLFLCFPSMSRKNKKPSVFEMTPATASLFCQAVQRIMISCRYFPTACGTLFPQKVKTFSLASHSMALSTTDNNGRNRRKSLK
jgi:hypothetical protein